ncbi:DUF3054 domain-containing protein [Georgenia subflava]|uniref:DUF3054 family protein n=1 Tax=Georgenia subflava TaxID=1622177 RepID=A0A6N7EGJ8_9MICO|nr:DUF3054 domain-containing protein [Georgenia subflava]MPV37502.1 DUF3054 family protein [Georgenia subflava]
MDTPPEPAVPGSRHPLKWFALDLACVLVFTVVGMLTHGTPPSGFFETVWPFVLGLGIAWALPGVRSLPLIIWPSGVLVWAVTTVVGLVLRGITGGGVSGAFPFVTAGVLALLLIGWRVVPEIKERRHEQQARYL